MTKNRLLLVPLVLASLAIAGPLRILGNNHPDNAFVRTTTVDGQSPATGTGTGTGKVITVGDFVHSTVTATASDWYLPTANWKFPDASDGSSITSNVPLQAVQTVTAYAQIQPLWQSLEAIESSWDRPSCSCVPISPTCVSVVSETITADDNSQPATAATVAGYDWPSANSNANLSPFSSLQATHIAKADEQATPVWLCTETADISSVTDSTPTVTSPPEPIFAQGLPLADFASSMVPASNAAHIAVTLARPTGKLSAAPHPLPPKVSNGWTSKMSLLPGPRPTSLSWRPPSPPLGTLTSKLLSSISRPSPMASSTPASPPDEKNQSTVREGYRNVIYFSNWDVYTSKFNPGDIDPAIVTHVLYAFGNIQEDGTIVSSDSWIDLERPYSASDRRTTPSGEENALGCVQELFKLKKAHRHIKVLLSIGGWTYSPKFAGPASTAAGRRRFASSAARLVADWGLDGIDIDWEYPSTNAEAKNLVLLLQACREALDQLAKDDLDGKYHFELTLASPAINIGVLDLSSMNRYLDAWHVMAYDYIGGWEPKGITRHQANLFPSEIVTQNYIRLRLDGSDGAKQMPPLDQKSSFGAVAYYEAAGVARSKIVLGMPLYGRSVASTSGLGTMYDGMGDGSVVSGQESEGIYQYNELPRPGATEYFDAVAMAAYSYDPTKREFVSYDNALSGAAKAQWIVNMHLGGAMFWAVSGDKRGKQSVVRAVADSLGSLQTYRNLLSYPSSRYKNIREGLPDFVVQALNN